MLKLNKSEVESFIEDAPLDNILTITYDGVTLHFFRRNIHCDVKKESESLLIKRRDGKRFLINIGDISSMTTFPVEKGVAV